MSNIRKEKKKYHLLSTQLHDKAKHMTCYLFIPNIINEETIKVYAKDQQLFVIGEIKTSSNLDDQPSVKEAFELTFELPIKVESHVISVDTLQDGLKVQIEEKKW
ncbi:Hsp20 family protein [Pelagirhabdus alkalitolerans]|uniref:Hsp20 family protein n=1 Tax=Pelagirhabdus alkalitolerans TaxID=1612202 RepID=UPI000B842321|nr:Hsp20 family protein [Pelagirhabdus alkalitolerans]